MASRCFYQNNKKVYCYTNKKKLCTKSNLSCNSLFYIYQLIFQCLLQIIRNLLKFFLFLSLLHRFKDFFDIIQYKSYKTIKLFVCHSHIYYHPFTAFIIKQPLHVTPIITGSIKCVKPN